MSAELIKSTVEGSVGIKGEVHAKAKAICFGKVLHSYLLVYFWCDVIRRKVNKQDNTKVMYVRTVLLLDSCRVSALFNSLSRLDRTKIIAPWKEVFLPSFRQMNQEHRHTCSLSLLASNANVSLELSLLGLGFLLTLISGKHRATKHNAG